MLHFEMACVELMTEVPGSNPGRPTSLYHSREFRSISTVAAADQRPTRASPWPRLARVTLMARILLWVLRALRGRSLARATRL